LAGDYDGDIGLVIWDPRIVTPFVPADLAHSIEPPDIAKCFSQENQRVSDFLEAMASKPLEAKMRFLQEVLLSDLRDSTIVGMYSGYHDNATYYLGYDKPETVRLAYMYVVAMSYLKFSQSPLYARFCKVLDSSKTGLSVLPEVLEQESRWKGPTPFWKLTAEEKSKISEDEADVLCRRTCGGKPFIMDTLAREATKAGKRKLEEVEKLFAIEKQDGILDVHLEQPWLNAQKIAHRCLAEENITRMNRDLEKIKDHVKSIYELYKIVVGKEQSSHVQREKIRQLSREFASKPLSEELMMNKQDISRVRASFAYLYDSTQSTGSRYSLFPWDMAMRELCHIKGKVFLHRHSSLLPTEILFSRCPPGIIKNRHHGFL
jgi:RNA-dependent RNA polymerase